jgi:hypothetical protein
MEEEMINAQGGSCGRLQGGFQRVIYILHFMRFVTMVITMRDSFVTTFEVEVVEPNLEYERR